MARGVRVAPRGDQTIYVEHGVWYDERNREIHVTCSGDPQPFHIRLRNDPNSTAHSPLWYEHFKRLLQSEGRWPEGVG